jgi:predicted HicB family RNase H-like nuclease
MKTKETRQARIRKLAASYPRVIEWSDEDQVFIGSAPPLAGQCCHGDTEADVARQLADIVEDLAGDVIDGKMPAPSVPDGRTYSGKFIVRISPALHRRAALQAMARGESLNQFVSDRLAGMP